MSDEQLNPEHKSWTQLTGQTGDFGRDSFMIECGWCGTDCRVYTWSLSGSGKRCPNKSCRVLHCASGHSIDDKGNHRGGWGKMNCENCGAPKDGDCDYCGTTHAILKVVEKKPAKLHNPDRPRTDEEIKELAAQCIEDIDLT